MFKLKCFIPKLHKKQNSFTLITNQIRIDQIYTDIQNCLLRVLKSETSKMYTIQYKYNNKYLNKLMCHHKAAINLNFNILSDIKYLLCLRVVTYIKIS